jgi:WD40 repeat protein
MAAEFLNLPHIPIRRIQGGRDSCLYSTPSVSWTTALRNPRLPISNAVTAASERCGRVDRALSELKTLGRHSGDVWAAITPDGLKAISASSDQTLNLWDLTSAIALNTFTGHLIKLSQ